MDITYANQITLTVSEKEVFLRFAMLHPSYKANGDPEEQPAVSNEKVIVLSRDGFAALQELINRDFQEPKR